MKKGDRVIGKWGVWSFIFLILTLTLTLTFGYAGEKEDLQHLNLEWRAVSAEYNLALERFQQVSPEFQALKRFAAQLDKKGFVLQDNGKGKLTIVAKPKQETPKSPEAQENK